MTCRNVQRFRGGLVFKAQRLCVSLNSRLESNKEEEDLSASLRSACFCFLRSICFWRVMFVSTSTCAGQLLIRNVKRFRGGLVFKAHRLLYHSTLGLRVIKKKKSAGPRPGFRKSEAAPKACWWSHFRQLFTHFVAHSVNFPQIQNLENEGLLLKGVVRLDVHRVQGLGFRV